MKKIFFVILCLEVFFYCSSAQLIDSTVIERAKKIVGFQRTLQIRALHSINLPEQSLSQKPLTVQEFEILSKGVHFVRVLESPFKNTEYYLLFYQLGSDEYYVVCSYSDTLILYPQDTSMSYAEKSSLDFLNRRLKDESDFGSSRVMDLFLFYNKLKYPGDDSEHVILHSWEDIEWHKDENVPRNIKDSIQEPKIEKKEDGYIITAYVLWKPLAMLRKVTFIYREKSISIDAIELGQYGASHIKL